MVHIPAIGDALPRWGNRFTRAIGRFLLWLFGWRVQGVIPNVAKLVVIGAPHTSNWDGFLMALLWLALGIDFKWMGKHTLFRPPFGGLLKWLGGIPINRTATHGVVAATIAEFQQRDQLVLVLAPEGTRQQVSRWKTGFYHIAAGAEVPILPGVVYNDQRLVEFAPVIYPTGNLESDMSRILAAYRRTAKTLPEVEPPTS